MYPVEGKKEASCSHHAEVSAGSQGGDKMQRKTVLVVEDDRDIRSSMELFLEEEGYAVVTADNGQAALERIPHLPQPSVVLLDLMMPKLDGYGPTRYAPTEPRSREILD
jgi:CheY-like chemotaxis protein